MLFIAINMRNISMTEKEWALSTEIETLSCTWYFYFYWNRYSTMNAQSRILNVVYLMTTSFVWNKNFCRAGKARARTDLPFASWARSQPHWRRLCNDCQLIKLCEWWRDFKGYRKCEKEFNIIWKYLWLNFFGSSF